MQLDHVGFAYPEAGGESLSEISLMIAPGERIGIIGRVASGKSTLGRLICGLYEPTAGSYRIDGLDSRQHQPHDMRAQLRFVGQDAELFSGTIRENLLIGSENAGDGEIALAIEQSGVGAFLGKDANGFDFHIGERGSRLSGGQRSFLVLARALVEPARLLFLDEPTAGLDPIGAAKFDRLTRELQETLGLTVFLITHDLDTLYEICDRVAVIADKTIIAVGTIPELVATGHPWIEEYFNGPRGRSAHATHIRGENA
jgi:ATP-binding cassette subfamily C protein LapB